MFRTFIFPKQGKVISAYLQEKEMILESIKSNVHDKKGFYDVFLLREKDKKGVAKPIWEYSCPNKSGTGCTTKVGRKLWDILHHKEKKDRIIKIRGYFITGADVYGVPIQTYGLFYPKLIE